MAFSSSPQNFPSVSRVAFAREKGNLAPTVESRAKSGAGGALATAPTAFTAGDYARAAQLFAAFEQTYPTDDRSEDAVFLMAVCRARVRDESGARLAARHYLQRYPYGLRQAEAERLAEGR